MTWLPDSEIFESLDHDFATLTDRLRETAFLTKALRIRITDERGGEWSEEFHFEGGIRDFVSHVNAEKDPIHPTIVYFEAEEDRWHCPCHEGNFDVRSGAVLSGPPTRPLGRIEVELRGDTIWALGYQP